MSDPKTRLGSAKLSFQYSPISAFFVTCNAMKFGSQKYGLKNYVDADKHHPVSIYIDAALRHIFLYMAGEDVARDSGVCHLDHAISGLTVLKDSQMMGKMVDDRVKYPQEYLDKLNEVFANESN